MKKTFKNRTISRRIQRPLVLFFLLLFASGEKPQIFAQTESQAEDIPQQSGGATITITADGDVVLSLIDPTKPIEVTKNVEIDYRTSEGSLMILKAPKLFIYLGGAGIEKLEMVGESFGGGEGEGDVNVDLQGKKATCGKLTYDYASQIIVLEGKKSDGGRPTILDKNQGMHADRFTYNLATGFFVASGAPEIIYVIPENSASSGTGGGSP